MKLTVLFILAVFSVIPFAIAQDDIPDTVIRIENQIPDFERSAQELMQTGKDAILETGKMLLPPGGGDDTKERFILTILAKDASRPQNVDKRPMVEEAFIAMLANAGHDEIKDFLLTQFHLFGSAASIEPLSQFLTHEKLYVNAAIALLSIGDTAAAPHFLAAIPSVSHEAKATFLRALGDLRYAAGIDAIKPYLADENVGIRLAALYALTHIGGMQVYETVLKTAHSETGIGQPQALSYLFDYAYLLNRKGQGYTAVQIANDVLNRYHPPENSHILCAALVVLVKVKQGYAIYDLMRYAGHELSDVSAAALVLAKEIPGKKFMEMWIELAERSDEAVRVKIMTMLNTREDYHAQIDLNYPPVSLDEVDADGFIPLFNNKDLTGWVGDTRGYLVEDSKLVCAPGGNLFSEKEFSDFVLRFEFKMPPGGNNGLGIRAPLDGNAAYAGMELQILDDPHPMYKDIKPWQAHGSVYGVVPAKRGYLREPGQWNVEEVTAAGNRIIIKLNGETIVNENIQKASASGTMDGQKHPGLLNPSGHIGFLGHGSRVEFRNIRIKELPLPEMDVVEEPVNAEAAPVEAETSTEKVLNDSGL